VRNTLVKARALRYAVSLVLVLFLLDRGLG